jgi:hypothetical protein
MVRHALIAGIVAALALAAGAQGAVSQTIYAYFDVDGGLQISYADSSKVGSTVPPGTYTINLNNNGADDLGVDHIFHLSGPGVDYKAANVDTTAVFSVTFQAGATYRFFDDLDPKISQTIVASNAPPATTTNPLPSTPVTGSTKATAGGVVGSQVAPTRRLSRGTLTAAVSASGKVTLSYHGKVVRSLKAGLYTVSVTDSSKKSGFVIQQSHKLATSVSSAPFTGKKSKTLALSKGQWFFYPSFIGQKTYFVVTG